MLWQRRMEHGHCLRHHHASPLTRWLFCSDPCSYHHRPPHFLILKEMVRRFFSVLFLMPSWFKNKSVAFFVFKPVSVTQPCNNWGTSHKTQAALLLMYTKAGLNVLNIREWPKIGSNHHVWHYKENPQFQGHSLLHSVPWETARNRGFEHSPQ